MTIKNFLLLVFLVTYSTCYTQTLKGVFSKQALNAVGDSNELTERVRKPVYFTYIYNKNKSLQELVEGDGGVFIDSVYKEHEELPGQRLASEIITIKPKKGFYFKDFKLSNYKVYFDQNNKETYISDVLPKYEWDLINENKIISGYKCKKATTIKKIANRTQNITAWYCEEIAINDGPMDFNGLPGFIIQLEINNSTIIKFEKIKIISNEVTEITLPEIKTKSITIKEYETNLLNGK